MQYMCIAKAPILLECDNWRQFATISRQRFKCNSHIAVSMNGHLCDKFTNFDLILKIYLARQSRDIHDRVSHDIPTDVVYIFIFIRTTQDIRESVA